MEQTNMKATINGVTVEGTPEQIQQLIGSGKSKRTKKPSVNGAPMDAVANIAVEQWERDNGEQMLRFKLDGHKTVSKPVDWLERAAEKYAAKGADSQHSTTGTDFVKVDKGDGFDTPIGYNLIQAKNEAGL